MTKKTETWPQNTTDT